MNAEGQLYLECSLEGSALKVLCEDQQRPGESTLQHYEQVPVSLEALRSATERILAIIAGADSQGCLNPTEWDTFTETCSSLYDELLSAAAKKKLAASSARFLLLNLDDNLVHIPWELLYDGKDFLCRRFAMGRRVRTRQEFVASPFRSSPVPGRMWILANPTGDLPASGEEGMALLDRLGPHESALSVELKIAPSVEDVKRRLKSYDFVHYAGHAVHNAVDPRRSAWRLADGLLGAEDIARLAGGKAPPLIVFSNACKSGATSEWRSGGADLLTGARSVYGLANAFLLAGVKHYIGSVVDLRDDRNPLAFASAFYEGLLESQPVGEALRRAREKSASESPARNVSWASYVLYGVPSATVFNPDRTPAPARDERAALPAPKGAGSGRRKLLAGTLIAAGLVLGGIWYGLRPPPATDLAQSGPSAFPAAATNAVELPALPLHGTLGSARAKDRLSGLREAVLSALPPDLARDAAVAALLRDAGVRLMLCQQYVRAWREDDGQFQVELPRDTETLLRLAVSKGNSTAPEGLYALMGRPRTLLDVQETRDGFSEPARTAEQALIAAFKGRGFDVLTPDKLVRTGNAGEIEDATAAEEVRALCDAYGVQLVVRGSCAGAFAADIALYEGLPPVKDYRAELRLDLWWAPDGEQLVLAVHTNRGEAPRSVATDPAVAAKETVRAVVSANTDALLKDLEAGWVQYMKDETTLHVQVEGCSRDEAERLQHYLAGIGQGISAVPESRTRYENGVASFDVLCRGSSGAVADLVPAAWAVPVSVVGRSLKFRAQPVVPAPHPDIGNFGVVLRGLTEEDCAAVAARLRSTGSSILRTSPAAGGQILEIETGLSYSELARLFLSDTAATAPRVTAAVPPWLELAPR